MLGDLYKIVAMWITDCRFLSQKMLTHAGTTELTLHNISPSTSWSWLLRQTCTYFLHISFPKLIANATNKMTPPARKANQLVKKIIYS